ncbi:MAG TPA: helix-turn-helix domain-containing protein [Anaeromyxobacter sp.]|nr:helix-turn-helix domain-containing protein [Anaeromyxobacter sp.]
MDGGRGYLLSVRAVAARLGVSTATVYGLCARGDLAHVRVSNAIRIDPDELRGFIHRRPDRASKPGRGGQPKGAVQMAENNWGSTASRGRGRPFKPGRSGNPRGRPYGVPNLVTTESRDLFRHLVEDNLPELERWLEETAKTDPGKAVELFLRLAEWVVPKLARVEFGIEDYTDAEMLAEVRRRRQLAEAAIAAKGSSTPPSGQVQPTADTPNPT